MVAKGILNANDMGLGKTAETALMLYSLRQVNPGESRRVLWLTKLQLIGSSIKELARWDMPAFGLPGQTKQQKEDALKMVMQLNMPYVIVTNYETARTVDLIRRPDMWDVIVIDETHRLRSGGKPGAIPPKCNIHNWNDQQTALKQSTAKTWFAVKCLLANNPKCFPIFLTGTPVQNKPEDMFAYLHLFDPERFDSLSDFQRTFGSKTPNGFFVNTQKLLPLLAGNFIRRRKSEVGIQMPPKNYTEHEVILDDKQHADFIRVLRQLTEEAVANLDTDKPLTITSILAELHYLRMLNVSAGWLPYNYYPVDPVTHERSDVPIRTKLEYKPSYPKIDYAFELICDLLDADEQIVVFSGQYKVPLHELHKLLSSVGIESAIIDGDTPNVSELEHRFQQGDLKILLINLASGAEGLNLHKTNDWPGGASQVIFLDRWWNPKMNEQAEDRCWRTGSREPVMIHILKIPRTVDDVIAIIEEEKRQMADGIMEADAIRPARDLIDRLRSIL